MNARAHANPSQTETRIFRAANTRLALAAIKAALGSDAIILETREVGGLFGKTEIEVTVSPPAEPAQARKGGAQPAAAVPRADLEQEVARLRQELERLQLGGSRGAGEGGGTQPGRATIYGRLVRRGVEEDVAFALVREAERRSTGGRIDLEAELEHLVRGKLPCAPPPWRVDPTGSRPRMVAMVGPTGVGKTTTIAKIAARALLESHLKVALITVDVYRLGATDQLARYGRIMGVPTYVARDESGLAAAAERCGDVDLILIDTAGRSDQAAREEQGRMLRRLPNVELHLLLSAATGGRELAAMAAKYAVVRPDLLAFSKLDETDAPGGILSAAAAMPCPISCVMDGQRVPEDIRPGSSRELTAMILNSGKPEAPRRSGHGISAYTGVSDDQGK